MPRKKSVAPDPNEQEVMDQTMDAVEGSVAEGPAGNDAAPSEETLAQMEQEYLASLADGAVPPEAVFDAPTEDGGSDGDTPPPGGDMSGSGEQTCKKQAVSGPEDEPQDSLPADDDAGGEGPPEGSPVGGEGEVSDDYAALLKELGEAGADDTGETPLLTDSEMPGGDSSTDAPLGLPDESSDPNGADPSDENLEGQSEPERRTPSARRGERTSPITAAASRRRERVLTIDARDEIQTDEDREAIIWHDIQNSHRTRRILTGMLDGVEKTESGLTLAVVNYRGFRVAIPVKEMMLYTGKTPSGREFMELMDQLNRILNARLGSEIDFIVKGYDNDSRSVVGSRREAMLRKRQTFYLDTDEMGEHLIYEGRVVQARVVAVAEKVIRVEVFGVETSIVARGLSWEWIGNARDHFNVGDRILVRVLKINRTDVEHLTIRVDARSVSATNSHDNLKKCMPQCRYAGRVTDVRNGVVFIRLNNGVNAIAHSCYDPRYPGKKDDVSFAVTRIDEEQGVAIGIITRIIKQNL